ncbi:MAG: hypothetical protein AAFN10_15435 [Bacteroidota bacterium]
MRHHHLLSLLFAFLIPFASFAQDRGISYQAVARDNSGSLIANTNLNVRFSVLQGGSNVFQESQFVTTNDYGLFTAIIGSSDFAGFNAIDWNAAESSLKVEVDDGSGFVDLGTTEIESVPYSKVATDMSIKDLKDVSGAPAPGDVLKWNGTDWVPDVDNAGGGSVWTQNGTDIEYSAGDVGIGIANPTHPLHIVHSTTNANTISIEAGAPPSARDVLEIKVDAGTANNAQFLELERGTIVVARINTDGSAEFPTIEYSDGTTQSAAGPVAKANLDITNTSTGAVTVNGTNNLTATYNNTSDYIEVTMTGVSLSPSTHIIQVTPIRINSTSATLDRSASIYFSGGSVRVYVWDASVNAAVANDCYITISEL